MSNDRPLPKGYAAPRCTIHRALEAWSHALDLHTQWDVARLRYRQDVQLGGSAQGSPGQQRRLDERAAVIMDLDRKYQAARVALGLRLRSLADDIWDGE